MQKVCNKIDEALLSELSEFVADQMGLYFPKERWRDLERGITSAAREFEFQDAQSCIEWLLSSSLSQRQVEVLASHLTVGETYFFRERRAFEILEQQILPELISLRQASERRIRIWSAGCATGEEPYSLAMLLDKMIPNHRDWNITILATDINPRFLHKACEGVYSEWSFRDAPHWIKERCFKKPKPGRYVIQPEIKEMVTFSYLNLSEDCFPSLLNNTNAMDLIFCRNVLMYFVPERVKKVIRNLHHCLLDEGWLAVSPTEASHQLFSEFVTVNSSGAILYRKSTKEIAEETEKRRIGETEMIFLPTLPPFSPSPILPLSDSPVLPLAETPAPSSHEDALALCEQGRYAEAERELAQILERDSGDSQAAALLAKVNANQGKLSEATEWCQKAIAVDKLAPVNHYLLATILVEQGQDMDAVQSLKRALYLDPNFVLAHMALGNLTRRQGKRKESDKSFVNALSLLDAYGQEDTLPESDGMTAGRLKEIIACVIL